LAEFAFRLIHILIAVVLHEIAHGFAAYIEGDDTPKRAGRLSLNPIVHIDPFFTIVFPLLLILAGSPVVFGGAKPVPVNPFNFRRGRLSDILVSSAGILTNLTLAVIFSLLLRFFPDMYEFLVPGIIINVVLFAFNVLPIPPLDGSRIIYHFLPYELKKIYVELERYGFFIIFLFLYFFSGIIWKIVEPIVNILSLIAG
jgi:Zn-dependent protease